MVKGGYAGITIRVKKRQAKDTIKGLAYIFVKMLADLLMGSKKTVLYD